MLLGDEAIIFILIASFIIFVAAVGQIKGWFPNKPNTAYVTTSR
jgi:hypothetical protein